MKILAPIVYATFSMGNRGWEILVPYSRCSIVDLPPRFVVTPEVEPNLYWLQQSNHWQPSLPRSLSSHFSNAIASPWLLCINMYIFVKIKINLSCCEITTLKTNCALIRHWLCIDSPLQSSMHPFLTSIHNFKCLRKCEGLYNLTLWYLWAKQITLVRR